jgi:D-alanine-D-alanine ligase
MVAEHQPAKLKLALIYGGRSGEHEVSLRTAAAVIGALDFDKYDVFPVFITKQGAFRLGAKLQSAQVDVEKLQFFESSGDLLQTLFGQSGPEFDVVFPLLHGTYGEDGTLQGLLEMANVPYVGTGVLASAVGMDKVMMKKVFAEAGLPQCKFIHFTKTQWLQVPEKILDQAEQSLGFPNFIKPANSGSSVGISKAKDREQLQAAIELALRFDRKVLIEEAIDGREVEVAVLGHNHIEASVVGEIVPSNEFYDYKAKYLDGKSEMVIPAQLNTETSELLRKLAVQAFAAIDGSGLSRVDFFVERTSGAIFLNEINTMPGFTPFSMYPLLWKETGKPYSQLLDELISLALSRHEERQSLQFSLE